MTIKQWKDAEYKEETLWKAICGDGRSSYDPKVVSKWVDKQQEAYMEKDWDWERIQKIVWDCKSVELIKFLDKIGVECNDMEAWHFDSGNFTLKKWGFPATKIIDKETYSIDREVFSEWLKLAQNESEIKAIEELKESFKEDLENKRCGWAYEKANDDFSYDFGGIDEKDDKEVAEFFGIDSEPIAWETYDGDLLELNEIEFCKDCQEANAKGKRVTKEQAKEWEEEEKEGWFYCEHCECDYPIDKEHIELNKHIPESEYVLEEL